MISALGCEPVRGNPRTVRVRNKSRPFWQRVLVAITLFAFAQAGFVTQTHIHPLPLSNELAAEKSHSNTPARDDSRHCPLCQEFLLAGAYVLPPPVVLPYPGFIAVENFIASYQSLSSVRFAHGWQSRAPPRI